VVWPGAMSTTVRTCVPPMLWFADIAPRPRAPNIAAETTVDVNVTPNMFAAGLTVLRESGAIEHPTSADKVFVAGIFKAMARARHSAVAVEVTLSGVLEPGAELVVKNESDQPIRVVADCAKG
jgi:hypothetical protein